MRRLIVLPLLLFALTGCGSMREYIAPQETELITTLDLARDNPERFINDREPVSQWWREFDDPLLAGLIEQALTTNHDVRIAFANLQQARALTRATDFDRLPTVTSSASYTRELNSGETASGSMLDRTTNAYAIGFDASWELDLFGRVSERIAVQAALEQAVAMELDDIHITVAADVARAYVELRGAQYRLDIAERNTRNQSDTLELTMKLFDGGRATSLDVSRAKAQLGLTRSGIPPIQSEVTALLNRLAVLTGQTPGLLNSKLSEPQPLPSLPVTVAVGNASELIQRRPDIRSAERELAASVAEYNVVASDLFPNVNLIGAIGFIASNIGSFGTTALAGAVGPSLNWRAFDLGRVRAEIAQADARSEAALVNYEKTVLRALEETQTALSDFSQEEERRAILQEATRSALESAQLAKLRFDEGVDDFLDVLDAERTQLEAENALAQSEIQAALDLITIYKSLAGGWQVAGANATTTALIDESAVINKQ